jgi:hypothetical protein
MKEICKISLDGSDVDSDCGGTLMEYTDVSEKLAFEFGDGGDLSEGDKARKKEVIEQLFNSALKCNRDHEECKPLDIIALRWKKCNVCNEELPKIRSEVVDPLRKLGIDVSYKEMDAKLDHGAKDLFIGAGCQGTPCILVADPHESRGYNKAYEGSQKQVGRLANILGLPNPFFYGDLDPNTLPKNMFPVDRRYNIKQNRSVDLKW